MSASVQYIREEDIIEQQNMAERRMLKEFEEGHFTIENPLVKLNPYLISPCAAVVLFRTEKETPVTVTVRGKTDTANLSHTFPKSKVHILPVLGLYPGFENTVDIELYQGLKNTIKITTHPKSEQAAELIHLHTTAQYLQNDLIFVTTPGMTGRLTGFDFQGNVRWYASIMLQMGIKRLKNGRLLVGSHRVINYPYYTCGLYEMDLVGKIYKEYLIPGGYHHDQTEMPNGDLLVLTDDFHSDTVEDVCVLIDRETGMVKKTWDYKDVIAPGDSNSGLATPEDWFHNNAVWYDENTHSLSLSGRHVDAIVNLDFDTGAINWIIGDPEGWSEEKQKYCFKPTGGKEFGWQYAQHAVSVLPDGDILCFDNGTKRSKNKEQYLANKDNYSRAVRYQINTEKMTIEQVWEYGKELGAEFFSQHISNVDCYGDEHYLVHSGGIQFYDGVPSETILPGASDPLARCESATVCLIKNDVVLDMRTSGNYYRAKKLSLYHEHGANLLIGDGRKAGNLSVTRQAEIPAGVSRGEKLPESCLGHVVEHAEHLFFKGRFESGQHVIIILEQGGHLLGYKVTTADKFARINCLPYIEGDDRNTSTFISKNGLSGLYNIKVFIDGEIYETDTVIDCF